MPDTIFVSPNCYSKKEKVSFNVPEDLLSLGIIDLCITMEKLFLEMSNSFVKCDTSRNRCDVKISVLK